MTTDDPARPAGQPAPAPPGAPGVPPPPPAAWSAPTAWPAAGVRPPGTPGPPGYPGAPLPSAPVRAAGVHRGVVTGLAVGLGLLALLVGFVAHQVVGDVGLPGTSAVRVAYPVMPDTFPDGRRSTLRMSLVQLKTHTTGWKCSASDAVNETYGRVPSVLCSAPYRTAPDASLFADHLPDGTLLWLTVTCTARPDHPGECVPFLQEVAEDVVGTAADRAAAKAWLGKHAHTDGRTTIGAVDLAAEQARGEFSFYPTG